LARGWVRLRLTRSPRLSCLALAALLALTPAGEALPAGGTDLDARLDVLIFKEPARIPELIANSRPSLLVFTDHHCAACLQMVPVVERLVPRYDGRVNLITIDPQDPHLAVRLLSAKYGVWGTPMLVLLDRTGAVRQKLYGPQLERTLASGLERLLRDAR
jgi:thiol-disulfide isomerase/thioredoxin